MLSLFKQRKVNVAIVRNKGESIVIHFTGDLPLTATLLTESVFDGVPKMLKDRLGVCKVSRVLNASDAATFIYMLKGYNEKEERFHD